MYYLFLSSDEHIFREAVKKSMSKNDSLVVVSYDRRGLKQTGTGHYSPIGGYHPQKDLGN